jgi:hypothetical protein
MSTQGPPSVGDRNSRTCPQTRNGLLFLVSGARKTTQGLVISLNGVQVQRSDLRERSTMGMGTCSGAPGLAATCGGLEGGQQRGVLSRCPDRLS